MDPVIVSAIITGVASAITAVISLRANRSASIPSTKEIRYQQLTKLFEPIERVFLIADNPNDAVKDIYLLLADNVKLAPPFLLEEVTRLKSTPHITWDDLLKLYTMNSSLFNWHCKHFGYSYNSERIIKKYTPVYNKQMLLKYLAPYAMLAVSFLLACISAILAFYYLFASESVWTGITEPQPPEKWAAGILISIPLILILFQNSKQ